MQILDGKVVAAARQKKIKTQADRFNQMRGRAPGLAVVLVGDDPASQVYVSAKLKACTEVGIHSVARRLPGNTTPEALKAAIQELNDDPVVDGILLQLPLPQGLDPDECIRWISPRKDVDCLTPENLGLFWSGKPLTIPCTPWGVMAILEHYNIPVAGMETVVVGRSNNVSKPMAQLLLLANATVTICHSKTKDLRAHTRRADLVVVAAGRRELLGLGDFRQGAIVVDVGIHREPLPNGKSRLFGDVRLKELEGVIQAATPVPGGVGPMTVTMLLENTLNLAERF